MRAAVYARVSDEEQVEGYSIDAQLRAARNLAQEKQWSIVHEYVDAGKSARSKDLTKRPKFKEMLIAANKREFDVLIVHKLDRFARNLAVTLRSFDELSKNNITFVSITEQIDYTTPMGRVFLAMSGAFAQLYSDNLSEETKKGWHERRSQGLYCGTLPFGAMEGKDGIPVRDLRERQSAEEVPPIIIKNYQGLKMAFEVAAQGKSDREVAIALNASGYRTTGTHGSRPFSKDTVKNMLKNRFYVGEIPDGNGGWLKAKHEPFVDQQLFDLVQEERLRRQRGMSSSRVRAKARTHSLSGIIWCKYCDSKLHIHMNSAGRARVYCGNKAKGFSCKSKSTFLEVYEAQIQWYLEEFSIPDEYAERILELHRKLTKAYENTKRRAQLERRSEKIRDLYKWGHISKDEYLSEYSDIQSELKTITPPTNKTKTLERLAHFLSNVADAWKEGSPEQRNQMTNILFERIWIEDNKVTAVEPRSELRPFFQISYEEHIKKSMNRPRGDSNPRSPP